MKEILKNGKKYVITNILFEAIKKKILFEDDLAVNPQTINNTQQNNIQQQSNGQVNSQVNNPQTINNTQQQNNNTQSDNLLNYIQNIFLSLYGTKIFRIKNYVDLFQKNLSKQLKSLNKTDIDISSSVVNTLRNDIKNDCGELANNFYNKLKNTGLKIEINNQNSQNNKNITNEAKGEPSFILQTGNNKNNNLKSINLNSNEVKNDINVMLQKFLENKFNNIFNDDFVKKSIKKSPELEPEFVKNVLTKLKNWIIQAIYSSSEDAIAPDSDITDFGEINLKDKSTSIDALWDKFVDVIDKSEPDTELDSLYLGIFKKIIDFVYKIENKIKGDESDNENSSNPIESYKKHMLRAYNVYKHNYDEMDNLLKTLEINDNIINEIMKYMEKYNSDQLQKIVNNKNILNRMIHNIIMNIVLHKSHKYAPRTFNTGVYEAKNSTNNDLDDDKNINGKNLRNLLIIFETYLSKTNEIINAEYEKINQINVSDNIKEMVETFENEINELFQKTMPEYNNFIVVKNLKRFMEQEIMNRMEQKEVDDFYEKIKKTGDGKIIYLLEEYEKIMGKELEKSDIKDYEKIYNETKEKIREMNDIITSFKRLAKNKNFVYRIDYYINDVYKLQEDVKQDILTVKNKKDMNTEYVRKCLAYENLFEIYKMINADKSLMNKHNKFKMDIINEMFNGKDTDDVSLKKLFKNCWQARLKTPISELLTVFTKNRAIREKYDLSQEYEITGLWQQKPIIIINKNDKSFVGVVFFISLNNIYNALRDIGNIKIPKLKGKKLI